MEYVFSIPIFGSWLCTTCKGLEKVVDVNKVTARKLDVCMYVQGIYVRKVKYGVRIRLYCTVRMVFFFLPSIILCTTDADGSH